MLIEQRRVEDAHVDGSRPHAFDVHHLDDLRCVEGHVRVPVVVRDEWRLRGKRDKEQKHPHQAHGEVLLLGNWLGVVEHHRPPAVRTHEQGQRQDDREHEGPHREAREHRKEDSAEGEGEQEEHLSLRRPDLAHAKPRNVKPPAGEGGHVQQGDPCEEGQGGTGPNQGACPCCTRGQIRAEQAVEQAEEPAWIMADGEGRDAARSGGHDPAYHPQAQAAKDEDGRGTQRRPAE